MVAIDAVKPHPRNARKGNVKMIAASLERFGQTKPIVVQQSTGFVVAGNHTLAAAEKLGWKEIEVVYVDMDDQQASDYLLVDNRTSDVARYKESDLLKIAQPRLDELSEFWSADDIDELVSVAAQQDGEIDVDAGAPIVEESTGGTVSKDGPSKEARERTEPMRDIVILMRASDAVEFGAKISELMKLYGTATMSETVQRAIDDALTVARA